MAMEGPLSECGAIGSMESTLVIPGEVDESLNELSREMIQRLKAMYIYNASSTKRRGVHNSRFLHALTIRDVSTSLDMTVDT